MALNGDEKELLALVRYYNQKRADKSVARLTRKLANNLDTESAASLTGFSLAEVDALITEANNAYKRKVKESAKTKQAVTENMNPGEVEVPESTRNVEPTFDETVLASRVAKEIYEKWVRDVSSGSPIPSSKQLAAELVCGTVTITAANKVLLEQNLIEPVEASNPRKGYVVK